ncbi:MAG: hypothetical protein QXU40_01975 [Candidatus Pacearchaeota archaeon]
MNKRGQITIFIIIAILILSVVLIYFFVRPNIYKKIAPSYADPVYKTFLSCVEDSLWAGINILESQGGYIYLPEFEPGSSYMPFSSQLNFLGNPIPYWYYVSANNIPKEQVPTKEIMEQQLGKFLKENIKNCNYDRYYNQGFKISFGEASPSVLIKEDRVETDIDMDLLVYKGNETFLARKHKISVNSKLGALYNSAKKVYEEEKRSMFLENYSIDILYNYAPVDGVEMRCSPLIFNANEVFDTLQNAIEANVQAISNKRKKGDYFFVDVPVKEEVRFLNSKNWPNRFDVSPSENGLMISTPIGNHPTLLLLGICYTPYHYVYSLKYPVLIQLTSDNGELFQFPVAVVIENNNPRKSLDINSLGPPYEDLCLYKNTDMEIVISDKYGNPVDADVFFECVSTRCMMGKSSGGILRTKFPQCVNGFVLASAEGFKTSKELFSTISSQRLNIIMEKFYKKRVRLKLDGRDYIGDAILNFVSIQENNSTKVLIYPSQDVVELSQGEYEVQVYIFKNISNSSLLMNETISKQCVEVPISGPLSVFNLKHKVCFDVKISEQTPSQTLIGGGKEKYYISDSELMSSNVLEINAESLPEPNTLEQLGRNYLLFETKSVEIKFV